MKRIMISVMFAFGLAACGNVRATHVGGERRDHYAANGEHTTDLASRCESACVEWKDGDHCAKFSDDMADTCARFLYRGR